MQENKKRKSAYAALLLFMYLLGSICALFLAPEAMRFSAEDTEILKLILSFVVLLDSLLFSSMVGLALLPMSVFAIGASSTMLISIVENTLILENEYYIFAVLAVLIPFSFVICGEGMEISWQLRHLMSSKRISYKKKLFLSYSIMFIGMVVFALLCRNILTI